jgi:hypothetical protein
MEAGTPLLAMYADAALAISDPEMHLPPRARRLCRTRYPALLLSLLMGIVTANWGRRACH